MKDLIGKQVGNYEIVAKIGEGGMATVYRARQLNIRREVAIKVVASTLTHMEEFTHRFEREVETVANLTHAHILKLFDYGRSGDLIYFVMELLQGGSLAERIQRGRLSMQETAKVVDQIASALDYAHMRGIIHRDLKPQNVLFDDGGNAFLTDFGIAKIAQDATLTQPGMAMGTPAYMSPEQWRGIPLDARSDVYSLGILLFEMLTGQLPFNSETPIGLMHAHVYEPLPSLRNFLPDAPDSVIAVINKALAKDRDARFATAGSLSEAFKIAITGQMPLGILDEVGTPTAAIPAAPNSGGARAASQSDQEGGALGSPRQATPLGVADGREIKSTRVANPLILGGVAVILILVVLIVVVLGGRGDSDEGTATAAVGVPTGATSAASAEATNSGSTGLASDEQTATAMAQNPTSEATVNVSIPFDEQTATAMSGNTTQSVTEEATIRATQTGDATEAATAEATSGSGLVAVTSPTDTPTITPSLTRTLTRTLTFTPTSTASFTPSRTLTFTPTIDVEATVNARLTAASGLLTQTAEFGATQTTNAVASFTKTPTNTATFTPSATASNTPTNTATATATLTFTPSNTSTATVTFTPSVVPTPLGQNTFLILEAFYDGQHSEAGTDRELYRLDLRDGSVIRLTNEPLSDDSANISPDGSKVAFVSYRKANGKIFIMDIDGGNVTELNPDSNFQEWTPVWSPDGTKIAYTTNNTGVHQIFVANADGSRPVRITANNGGSYFPAWSPDGRRIAFHTNRTGDLEIFSVDVNGRNQIQLTRREGLDAFPNYSPDGTEIAWSWMDPSGTWRMFLMNVDGSNQRQITPDNMFAAFPQFSKDGTQIFFLSGQIGNPEIWVINRDGSNPRFIASLSRPPEGYRR
ncbi:MAG: hypothetical protein OHK0023_24190 [Anaerolineae bacterium]